MRGLDGFDGVVVLADVLGLDPAGPTEARRDLERTEPSVLASLLGAVRGLGLRCTHYARPDELARNAAAHARDVVLSIYGGERSRSRMMIAPAVCEALGLAYVGLDAYGRAVAQDKEASKALARNCGLLTPDAVVLRRPEDLWACSSFPRPYVLKPLLEGSSIGISQRNLVRDAGDGLRLAAALLAEFDQPVIMEAFVAGREVSLVAVEREAGPDVRLVEVVVEGDPDHFVERLFDADEKFRRRLPRRAVGIDGSAVAEADWLAARRLLEAIGHFGYARVDGRLSRGRFHFIELTPDAFIGPLGQMAAPFLDDGSGYEGFIEAVLRSATLRPRDRRSSG